MKRVTQFQIACGATITVVAFLFITFVVRERPETERTWWLLGMAAVVVLFRKLVYEPISRRIGDE